MAGSGGNSDFLYKVGCDTTQATAELRDFANKTAPGLLGSIKPLEVVVNTSGASRNLATLSTDAAKTAAAVKELQGSLSGLTRAIATVPSSLNGFTTGMGRLGDNFLGAARSATIFTRESERLGGAAKNAGSSLDYLGKMAATDLVKLAAWGAAFTAVEGSIHGFTDALGQAGEVQMEQTLQRLYNNTIDVNRAFTAAESIAKAWGGNIVDVQQAIGLWTKQTNDLAAATMLANKGEEMARASGIATAEVYRDSLAIGTQMGLTYGQLPAVYDQITRAALKLGETLRGVNDRASEGTEAMKDLFQGLSRAAATLSANSFADPQNKLKGTAAIIAIVANQITAMGDSGKTAATNLASMFGALSQGGPKRGEWEKILGVDAFKNADTLLQAMQKHLAELTQAQANGTLGVRPQQVETLSTMEKSLAHINELYRDIANNSKGSLNLVAISEMETYQAQVDRLKTAIQALEISVGRQLLPQMEGWVNWLGSSAIPQIESMSPALIGASQDVLRLAGAWAALQAIFKVNSLWQATTAQVTANTAAVNANVIAETRARAAGFEDIATLEKLRGSLATYNENLAATTEANALLSEAFAKLGSQAGLTEAQLARVSPAAREAGNALNLLREVTATDVTTFTQLDGALEQADGQLNLFAAAAARAAATEAELRNATEVAGGAALASVTGWQRAAQGIGLIATNAAATLGPLAAMTAGLWAAQQAAKAGNAGDNAALAVQNWAHSRTDADAALVGAWGYDQNRTPSDFVRGIGTSIQGSLGAWFYGTGQQQTSGAGNALIYQMLRSQQFGSQTSADLSGMRRTQFGDRGAYDKYEQDLEDTAKSFTEMQGVTKQTSTEMQSLESELHKMAQASSGFAGALAHQMGAGDASRAFYTGKPVSASGGNPFAQQVTQSASAYDALVKAKDALISRDDIEIKTNETLIGLYGAQPKFINSINAAYNDKISQEQQIVTATKAYIATLTKEISADQATATSRTATSKQKQQASAAELKAENALVVAHGTLLEAEAKVTQVEADRANTLEQLHIKQDLYRIGITDLTTQLKQMSDNLQLLKGHDADQLNLANQNIVTLRQWATALQTLITHYQSLGYGTKQLQTDLNAVNQALATDQALAKSDTDAITKLTESIGKAIEELEKSNFDTLGGILGINKQTLSYVDQMLQALQQIDATQQQINRDRNSATPDQQRLLDMEQTELNLRKQLLPIEQQILAIRSSALYQAWDSEIDKMGSSFLDKQVGKLFGGTGQSGLLGAFHEFFAGITSQVVNSWWKQVSENISDSLFGGGSQETKLRQDFAVLYASLQKEFALYNTTATGPVTTSANTNLNAANIMLQASQNNLRAATGGGTGSGLVNSGVDPYSAMANAAQDAYDARYGVTNDMDVGQSYASANTTANNTTTMVSLMQTMLSNGNANASDIQSTLAAISVAGSGGGIGSLSIPGAAGGGGGGLLGGLFGMLGLGGGGGAAGVGGLGGLGGLLTMALGAGSMFGGLLGSNTGAAGTSGREGFGMMGALAGLLGAGAFAAVGLGGLGGIGLGGLFAGMASGPFLPITLGAILLGSLLGGMMGDHFPIQNEPDIGEPVEGGVSYGQFVANINGSTANMNGKAYNPFQQYQGNDREALQLETDVQKVLNNPNASPQLKQMAKQLQALNPSNQPEGFSIKSEYNDVFTLHSGAQVNVESYMKLVQAFMQAYGQQQQQPLAPIISINGAASFNPYNTPGLTNSEFGNLEQGYVYNAGGGAAGGGTSGGSSYSTPGYGGSAPVTGGYSRGGSGYGGYGGAAGNVTVQLLVNGKVLAQIVNAYNAQYLLNSGRSIDQIPVL